MHGHKGSSQGSEIPGQYGPFQSQIPGNLTPGQSCLPGGQHQFNQYPSQQQSRIFWTMNEIASFPPPIRPQFPPGSVRPGLPPLQPVNETHARAASQGRMTPRPGLSSLTTEISTATTTVYWAISGKHV
eukprot:m.302362 g.302362  ORF g.302362 m.302362 type:complete len:129 (+) comp40813_c0_seq58:102-488(+)